MSGGGVLVILDNPIFPSILNTPQTEWFSLHNMVCLGSLGNMWGVFDSTSYGPQLKARSRANCSLQINVLFPFGCQITFEVDQFCQYILTGKLVTETHPKSMFSAHPAA